MELAPASSLVLEQVEVWFTAAQRRAFMSAVAPANTLVFSSGPCGPSAGDMLGRGSVVCTATDTNGKALRMICSICDHWRASLSKEAMV